MGVEYREIELAGVNRRFQLRKSLSKEQGAEVVESIKRNGVVHAPAR